MRRTPLRRRTSLKTKKSLGKPRVSKKPSPDWRRQWRIRITAEDRRTAEKVKERDGWRCRYDGTFYGKGHRGLHAAHIFSRAIKATRHDLENLVSLCHGHHRMFHRKPLEFHEWVRGVILGSERYAALRLRAKTAGGSKV